MNSREMDWSVATPNTIRMIEGGISRPRVAEPARVPITRLSS